MCMCRDISPPLACRLRPDKQTKCRVNPSGVGSLNTTSRMSWALLSLAIHTDRNIFVAWSGDAETRNLDRWTKSRKFWHDVWVGHQIAGDIHFFACILHCLIHRLLGGCMHGRAGVIPVLVLVMIVHVICSKSTHAHC